MLLNILQCATENDVPPNVDTAEERGGNMGGGPLSQPWPMSRFLEKQEP